MPEPTEILTHSDDAISRLIDFFRDKINVQRFLRCKSAARVDIKNAIENEEYVLTVNDCQLSITAERNDTPVVLATNFVDLIEAGGGVIERDAFDNFDLGPLGGQPGPFGDWLVFESKPSLVVSDAISLSPPQSVRSNYEQHLPPSNSPEFSNANYLIGYPGSNDAIQRVEYYIKFDDGWPGTSNANYYFFPIYDSFFGAGPSLLFWAVTTDLINFDLQAILSGNPPINFGSVPISALVDGSWHKVYMEFDTAGTYITFEIDDGDWGGTQPGVSPIPVNSFIFGHGYNSHDLPWPGFRNVYRDNLKVGTPPDCAIEDEATFVPNPPESLEDYTNGNPFDGPGVYATWSDTPPFPTGAPYLGGYIVTNVDARTGSKSIRTDMVAGGIGPDDGGDPIQTIHGAATAVYPGQVYDLQKMEMWFKTPGSSFPGTAFETVGAFLSPLTFTFLDFSSFIILLATLAVDSSDSYANYQIYLELAGGAKSSIVSIPRASLDDGEWHKFTMEFRLNVGTVVFMIDDNPSWSISLPLPGVMTVWYVGLLSYFNGLSSTTAVVGDWYFDDIVVGGTMDEYIPFKAKKLNPEDDFFYLTPRRTPGLEINAVAEDETKIGVFRIGVVDQLQELEHASFNVFTNRWLDSAEGVQLDKLGILLGRLRSGSLSDDDFRQLLGIQITRNLSQGEPERLIQITAALTNSDNVKLLEYFPGFVDISYSGEAISPGALVSLIDSVAAGGVKIGLNQIPENPFRFFGDGPPDEGGFNDGEFAGTPGLTPGTFPGPVITEDFSGFSDGEEIRGSGVLGPYRQYPNPGAVKFGPLIKAALFNRADAILDDLTLNNGETYSKGLAIVVPNNPNYSLWTANQAYFNVTLSDLVGETHSEVHASLLALSSFDFDESGIQNIVAGIRLRVDQVTNTATMDFYDNNSIVYSVPVPGSISAAGTFFQFWYNRTSGWLRADIGLENIIRTITPFNTIPVIGVVLALAVYYATTPGTFNLNPKAGGLKIAHLE